LEPSPSARLAVRRARVDELSIGELTVDRLIAREQASAYERI
jgi:hypothetical protein